MLSGYHRGAEIKNSEFVYTGGSAIAAWGRTDELTDNGIHGYDATDGNIPANTMVASNIMRETGIWEKQSSCFFQAKTAATTLLNNMCFNLPRAGFNFNDGLGGGDEVHQNLIFNSCRETSDHGPINSWDRQPFVSTFGANGSEPTAHMRPRNISYNFLVANYGGGNGAIDNDDESLRYENNHNFQVRPVCLSVCLSGTCHAPTSTRVATRVPVPALIGIVGASFHSPNALHSKRANVTDYPTVLELVGLDTDVGPTHDDIYQ